MADHNFKRPDFSQSHPHSLQAKHHLQAHHGHPQTTSSSLLPKTILLTPTPTGNPTTTTPATISHFTTPLASARCSSLIVWPSTRKCSMPSFVEESSETRWPSEALPREGLCCAEAHEVSSGGLRFFFERSGEVVVSGRIRRTDVWRNLIGLRRGWESLHTAVRFLIVFFQFEKPSCRPYQ